MESTQDIAYGLRLQELEGVWWKRLLDVQRPYRWNLRRLQLGRVLDIGCGIGRNLAAVDGVGVDHNPYSIQIARDRGYRAYLPDELAGSAWGNTEFDSLLLAHVIEHLDEKEGNELVSAYLPKLKNGGRVVFITPQERGYLSDSTHVRFVGYEEIEKLCRASGLSVERKYSFPFPRFTGKSFKYNEFVVIARKA